MSTVVKKADPTIFLLDMDPTNFVRLSYLHCFEYQEFVNDKGEKVKNWSVSAIVAKAHPVIPKLVAIMKEVANTKWADKGPEIYAQLKAQDRLCIHDGNNKNEEVYKGQWYISCNSKVRPTVIDSNRVALVAADGRPYSGCYGNVEIGVWAQDIKGAPGKRINAQLMGVQFWRHGDAFTGAGRVSDANEFPEAAAADDDAPAQAATGRDPLE